MSNNHIYSISGVNGTLYFPAVGMKNSSTKGDGSVTSSNDGYYWSSTSPTANDFASVFYFTSIIAMSSLAVQSALPIRCIRE